MTISPATGRIEEILFLGCELNVGCVAIPEGLVTLNRTRRRVFIISSLCSMPLLERYCK